MLRIIHSRLDWLDINRIRKTESLTQLRMI
uniref:Uncharacterized protein n=1 Tax=virus sp. ctML55 TaxID=2827627 RepID=A0A8S5RHK1_9VIRU|nr:MAG TPA: hypothetical protein [virus sp. ctML55]